MAVPLCASVCGADGMCCRADAGVQAGDNAENDALQPEGYDPHPNPSRSAAVSVCFSALCASCRVCLSYYSVCVCRRVTRMFADLGLDMDGIDMLIMEWKVRPLSLSLSLSPLLSLLAVTRGVVVGACSPRVIACMGCGIECAVVVVPASISFSASLCVLVGGQPHAVRVLAHRVSCGL